MTYGAGPIGEEDESIKEGNKLLRGRTTVQSISSKGTSSPVGRLGGKSEKGGSAVKTVRTTRKGHRRSCAKSVAPERRKKKKTMASRQAAVNNH